MRELRFQYYIFVVIYWKMFSSQNLFLYPEDLNGILIVTKRFLLDTLQKIAATLCANELKILKLISFSHFSDHHQYNANKIVFHAGM